MGEPERCAEDVVTVERLMNAITTFSFRGLAR